MRTDFDDLLAANAAYAEQFTLDGFDGIAHAGVAMVTCMDSRIEPLEMTGLRVGDAKIIRTPGDRLTPDALIGRILSVPLLGVERILLVSHTRCAMASGTDEEIAATVRTQTGADLSGIALGASPDRRSRLQEDVAALREHPLIGERASIGGFLYDVDRGTLTQLE